MVGNNVLIQAFLNIHGQSGLNVAKQLQIEDFIRRNKVDILHCQEINIDDDSFSQCYYIKSNFNILPNNAVNKYGTASLVKNTFSVENIKMDTKGRAIFFNINGMTLGNIYLPSGTDGISRAERENMCSETIPQLLVNRQANGSFGGDLNCVIDNRDCTHHPEAKQSPSLARLVRTFVLSDSFRAVHPSSNVYSRYYSAGGIIGASRLDRSYHWGDINTLEAFYVSVAFSDHFAYVTKITLPNLENLLSPETRPLFKISPEVVNDNIFKLRLHSEMKEWQQVKDRGLSVMKWWELIVKPGIRRLAIQRSKEINKSKRSSLNCLLLKQSFHTKELQAGNIDNFVKLRQVQGEIEEWYEMESKKVIVQSRVDDVQESEKIRIYHHEQHVKHCKKSAILKLETDEGLLLGHEDCSSFLYNQVKALLSQPVSLNTQAQNKLLAEVTPVFTESQNKALLAIPEKEEIKKILFSSNLNAAPGTDGITSLLYKVHWDVLGDSLLEVVTAVHQGEKLTKTQRTSLMVFGSKPKKPNSIKPSDKRRISLLNSDFKIITGLEAARFKETFIFTLSEYQIVAGNNKRIHHMINAARDCIYSVSKSKLGCALLDLDFVAAFDLQVFSWVFSVLRAKGVEEEVILRLKNIYNDCITIPVVNNVRGSPIINRRESLRQGCPGSMGWFSVAIDPLLLYLAKHLKGIPICSAPTAGPCLRDGTSPYPVSESYKVYGYADDVKPAVQSLAEFAIVDEGARLFELSSGCALHRDPIAGKCKVLPLGKWRTTLKQEDIGLPYMKICDTLSMVGVELTATWINTRKINNEILLKKVQTCINSWKSGKFMPLICRPFSVNTYCSSKIWFKTCSVDLRVCDVTAITSRLKSYCYQDLLQKPTEVLLYRKIEDGGLGLHHIQSKAKAHLIATFMQTAANDQFRSSLLHSWMFRFYVEGDDSLPEPGYTPYYDKSFFHLINSIKVRTSLNVVRMTVQQWYNSILELNVVKNEFEDGRSPELIPCRVEVKHPNICWTDIYQYSRLRGLSPESKSFLFKLIHELLPCKERLHQLGQSATSLCWCNSGEVETYKHLFFQCDMNKQAGQSLLKCLKSYDSLLTEEKCLRLELGSSEPFTLPSVSLLVTGLELIWKNRRQKKRTAVISIRAELENSVSIKRRSRVQRIRECASIMENMINNFLN